ncbi:hypothetical protein EOI67_23735 [Salmonella enterica]|nr:hypothetical protein [Salmonella enterica]EAS9893642.1 hypothetical protein [Salmonella enterica]
MHYSSPQGRKTQGEPALTRAIALAGAGRVSHYKNMTAPLARAAGWMLRTMWGVTIFHIKRAALPVRADFYLNRNGCFSVT